MNVELTTRAVKDTEAFPENVQVKQIMYYEESSDTVCVKRVKHRKDAYKKHNLPWQ